MKTSSNDQPKPNTNRDQFFKIGRRLFLAGVIASTVGCQNIIRRGQSPDVPLNTSKYESSFRSRPRAIGEICALVGLDSLKVYGVGLAAELKGTGSAPIESGQREHLQRELRLSHSNTTGIDSVKDLMTDKNTELVIIEGKIPPGARTGDHFDLQLVTMSESDATTLESGIVLQSRLRRMAHLGNRVKQGNVAATGAGPVIVKSIVNNTDAPEDKLHALIPGGGKALQDRILSLQIKGDDFNQKTALKIGQAINQRFTHRTSVGHDGVAEPKTDRKIDLQIPSAYRHNIGRYASVLNQLVFAENVKQRQERLAELEAQIGEPAKSALAALQLEAIGDKALPALRTALSHNDMEVRFHAAEALAYMGEAVGAPELIAAAKEKVSYRWHAFAALTAIDDRELSNSLSELFNHPEVSVRYGAFKTLRHKNEDDPIVSGDFLANGFFLHEVDSTAEPVIHFSTHRRAEIVIFGSEANFGDNFLYVESGLTIKNNNDQTISVTAYSPDFIKQERICSNHVADLVRTLAELGYGLGSQLEILRQASQNGTLNAEIAINASPKLDRTRRTRHIASDYENIKPDSPAKRLIDWANPRRGETSNPRHSQTN